MYSVNYFRSKKTSIDCSRERTYNRYRTFSSCLSYASALCLIALSFLRYGHLRYAFLRDAYLRDAFLRYDSVLCLFP